MLKRIAISTLFVVGMTFAGVSSVSAKAAGGKAGKVDVLRKAEGFPCGMGGFCQAVKVDMTQKAQGFQCGMGGKCIS
jgi:hypothetical protein